MKAKSENMIIMVVEQLLKWVLSDLDLKSKGLKLAVLKALYI